MKKQIDIFCIWVWFATNKEYYEFDNRELLYLLNIYCNKMHWMGVTGSFNNYTRKDIAATLLFYPVKEEFEQYNLMLN